MGSSSAEDVVEDPAGLVPRMEQSMSLSSHPWPNPLMAGSPPASRRAAAIQSDFMNQNLCFHGRRCATWRASAAATRGKVAPPDACSTSTLARHLIIRI